MIDHLYIHVPFCTSKCHYCGFYSVTSASEERIREYSQLIIREWTLRAAQNKEVRSMQPQTIYMGGGTPSLLGPDEFAVLAAALQESMDLSQLKEWSVEINPSSCSLQLLAVMRASGVNRVTFGMQSFEEKLLTLINRSHTVEQALTAVAMAKNAGFTNIGIDLIAGLPGVTPALWDSDLRMALALETTHLSVYNLSVEPNTRLAGMVQEGVRIPDEEEQLDLLSIAEERLTATGFTRYEISNYALQGYECEHNLGIWRGNDYLGLGPSAASRIGRERIENIPALGAYMDCIQSNKLPPQQIENCSQEDDATERALFALRLNEGFNPAECISKFGISSAIANEWESECQKLALTGAVERGGRGWRLTKRGCEVCDHVIRELLILTD